MIQTIKNLYLTNRFFLLFGGIIALFCLSFAVQILFPLVQALLIVAVVIVLIDVILLFNRNFEVTGKRQVPKIFSLGDENPITLSFESKSNLPVHLTIIDELPEQFQERDFSLKVFFSNKKKARLAKYNLRPTTRGEYQFGHANAFAATQIGLIQRRFQIAEPQIVSVYPSVQQMKKYELKAMQRISHFQGIKKIRRLGHSYEFEQIKNYVKGDDYRSVNWKATGRRSELMVNQYENERAQQVYVVIDKSRVMKMPFEGMNLLDYAINSGLVITNIALQKHDKAGLLTFSDKMGTVIRAERNPVQLRKIITALYNEKERHFEANYELLYYASRSVIKGRSLVLLYTNFESMYAMERVLPILRKINRLHLLVVIFFENTEIADFIEGKADDTESIYIQTVARGFITEKRQIVSTLRKYGIQTILTRPEDLSVNTVNKYLELKSRGMI